MQMRTPVFIFKVIQLPQTKSCQELPRVVLAFLAELKKFGNVMLWLSFHLFSNLGNTVATIGANEFRMRLLWFCDANTHFWLYFRAPSTPKKQIVAQSFQQLPRVVLDFLVELRNPRRLLNMFSQFEHLPGAGIPARRISVCLPSSLVNLLSHIGTLADLAEHGSSETRMQEESQLSLITRCCKNQIHLSLSCTSIQPSSASHLKITLGQTDAK